MAQRYMSIRVPARGYPNMIGTDFEGCGTKPGLTFFHVERGKKVKLEKVEQGSEDEIFKGIFHMEDCYIFLETKRKDEEPRIKAIKGGSEFIWNVYVWKGSKANLIYFGLAGTKAKDLHGKLIANGNYNDCKIFKEREGEETKTFKALFPDCSIEVRPGKRSKEEIEVGSGDAKISKIPKLFAVYQDRLYRIPIRQDCIEDDRNYILDIGTHVYSYSGSKCGRIEKAYTAEMARRRCKVDYKKIISAINIETADESKTAEFFTALENYEQEQWSQWSDFNSPILLEYNGESLIPASVAEAGKLLDRDLLAPNKVFVLDCDSEIYVWFGRSSSPKDKKGAVKLAKELVKLPGKPSFLSIEIVRDRMEPVFFKERFYGFDNTDLLEIGGDADIESNDREIDIKERRVSEEVRRIIQFLEESEGPLEVDKDLHLTEDNSGKLDAFYITQNGDIFELNESKYGIFDSGLMYIYVYTCKNNTLHHIFTWEGNQVSIKAKTIAGIATSGTSVSGITDKYEGAKIFKYILQGREPQLLKLVLGRYGKPMIIHRGRAGGGYLKKKDRNPLGYRDEKSGATIFAFEVNSINEMPSQLTEVPLLTLLENGLYDGHSYIFLRGYFLKDENDDNSGVKKQPIEPNEENQNRSSEIVWDTKANYLYGHDHSSVKEMSNQAINSKVEGAAAGSRINDAIRLEKDNIKDYQDVTWGITEDVGVVSNEYRISDSETSAVRQNENIDSLANRNEDQKESSELVHFDDEFSNSTTEVGITEHHVLGSDVQELNDTKLNEPNSNIERATDQGETICDGATHQLNNENIKNSQVSSNNHTGHTEMDSDDDGNVYSTEYSSATGIFFYNGSLSCKKNRECVKQIVHSIDLYELTNIRNDGTSAVELINDSDDNWRSGFPDLSINNAENVLPECTRQVKLYKIQHSLKKVGSLFVLDVGKGVFCQKDLDSNEVYLLDTGSSKVYLWFGVKVSEDQVILGIETAVRYTVRGLKSMKNHVTQKTPDLVMVDSGNEDADFKSCFYGWDNALVDISPSKLWVPRTKSYLIKATETANLDDNYRRSMEAEARKSLKQEMLERKHKTFLFRKNKLKTLNRGKIMRYKKSYANVSIEDRLGDRIRIGTDNTIHIKDIGKPLSILQREPNKLDDVNADIRNGDSDWAIYTYDSPKELVYAGHGKGGLDRMCENIDNDKVYYCVIRVRAEDIKTDLSSTDRMIFILLVPESIRPILKAAVNVHRVIISELLGPFFTEMVIRDMKEISTQGLIDLASKAQT